jgi:hypothetical protein
MASLGHDYWGDSGRDPLLPPEGERWLGQVHCTQCSWQGSEEDLVVDFDGSRFTLTCPGCVVKQMLVYERFLQQQLKAAWVQAQHDPAHLGVVRGLEIARYGCEHRSRNGESGA